MRKFVAFLMTLTVWSMLISPAHAADATLPANNLAAGSLSNTHLVPCQQSDAFQQRMRNAPDNYYFDQPYQAYSANLLCGAEGLPHLQLRFDRALDVAIPFGIFFYVAGFIGWSGRAYLIGVYQRTKPEELEIFIDISLAMRSFAQGLLWPLVALKELTSGELTAKETEIYVSPR